jgi:DNA-binding NarL/FixJ family response regulator
VASEDDPSPEELEVMRLVAKGHKDAAIARRLGVAAVTVHRRAQRFARRVGARSRPHAIAIGIARGWIPPEGEEAGELRGRARDPDQSPHRRD